MVEFSDLKGTYVLHVFYSVIMIQLVCSLFPPLNINLLGTTLENVAVYGVIYWYSFKFSIRILFKVLKRHFNKSIQMNGKAVLITGCDSGFGHLLAKRLDSKGIKVFAGCLFPLGAGAKELNSRCSEQLKTLELDVTKDESVKAAYEFVKDNLNGSDLWTVVNNEGILRGTGVEITRLEDFKLCLEVNCLGVIRVTKTFLPLIRKSRGRIVNITSIGGRLALPRTIAYTTSKFAVTGFNDSLRQELNDWGVRVIAVEPFMFQTQLFKDDFDKLLDDSVQKLDENVKADYVEEYFEAMKERTKYYNNNASWNTDLVVDDLESAICLRYPDIIYRPCGNKSDKLFFYICLALPHTLQNTVINFFNRKDPKPRNAQK